MKLKIEFESEMRIRLMQLQLTQDIMAHKSIGLQPQLHIYQINVDAKTDEQSYYQELSCYAELYRYGNTELRKKICEHTKEYHPTVVMAMFNQIFKSCQDLDAHMQLARCGYLSKDAASNLIGVTPHKQVLEYYTNRSSELHAGYAQERLEKDFGDAK